MVAPGGPWALIVFSKMAVVAIPINGRPLRVFTGHVLDQMGGQAHIRIIIFDDGNIRPYLFDIVAAPV